MDNDDTMSGRKKSKGSLTPPPTLDLTASEIARESTTPPESVPESPIPAEAVPETPPPAEPLPESLETPPAPVEASEPIAASAGASVDEVPPTAEAPGPEAPLWGASAPEVPAPEAAVAELQAAPEAPADETAVQPKPEPEPVRAETVTPRLDVFDEPAPKPASVLPALAAALIGGVAGAALMLGIALWGFLPGPKSEAPGDPGAALAPRLAGIEQDAAAVRKLAEDTATRIAAVESAAKAASDTATSAVNLAAEAKNVATEASDKLAQLPPATGAPAPGTAAPAVDLGPLTSRLAKVEAAAKALQASLAPLDEKTAAAETGLADTGKRLDAVEKSLAAGPSDKTAAYAVALGGIGEALREGRPFESELAAAAAIGGQAEALAPLSALAPKGAPSIGVLSNQFDVLAPKLVEALTPKAAEPPADAGVLDRFWFSIVNSGTVTREGEPAPGEPGAPIRAIAERLHRGDLAGAVEAFRALPEAARSVGADWLAQAGAALDAQALVRTQTTATLQKLSKQ